MRFFFTRIVPALLVVVLALLAYIKIQYGLGKPYPDVGVANAPGRYEKLIKLDYPPGNIAVAANGDVYFNYHPIVKAQRFTSTSMFKLSNGRVTPFPSLAMQRELSGVFGMAIGPGNRLWMIAPASFDGDHTSLFAFDLNTGQRVLSFTFPGKAAQFAQDLRVTADGNYVLLADPGLFRFTDPKLIVFSVRDHSFRTALGATPCTRAEDWLMQTPFGPYRVFGGLLNFTVGLDGIAISPDQRWFYLGPMTNGKLCRVPLQTLLDPALEPEQVASKVEYIGPKPMSDGIATDAQGRVIMGDDEHGGIMLFDPATHKLTTLARDPKVIWPDGLAVAPNGDIVFTDSAIPAYLDQFGRPPTLARLIEHRPYYVYRLKR
jgi:sugar lactone lactonase YvrE